VASGELTFVFYSKQASTSDRSTPLHSSDCSKPRIPGSPNPIPSKTASVLTNQRVLCIRYRWPIHTHIKQALHWPLGVFNRTKFQFEFHFLFRYAHLGFCLSNFCLLSLPLRVVFFWCLLLYFISFLFVFKCSKQRP